MKKTLLISGILPLVIVALVGLWFWANSPYGEWKSTQKGEFDVFDGDIKIAEAMPKPGSLSKSFMIIYDKSYHALSCSDYGQKLYDVCLPFEMKAVDVKPGQKLEDIVEYAYMEPLYLRLKFKNFIFFQKLELALVPITTECAKDGECDFMPIGVFDRFWKFGF